MARVTLELPSVLRSVLGGVQTLSVEGDTLEEALEDAYDQLPTLKVHLCDESGQFRRHVLCFLNETNSRWFEGMNEPVKDGDQIIILQAVSGG